MKSIYRLALPLFGLLLGACGTVATPVWSEQAQGTQSALVATANHLTEIAPTATATPVPTETPTGAPTATPIPATPTEVPTEVPTATVEPPTAVPQQATSGEVTGDPEKGKEYFNMVRPEVDFACATCHHYDTEAQLIGPGLLNVSVRAASRVPGESAYEYIHTSIVNPGAFVVPGYPDGLMPKTYKDVWTEEQINDIIAYLFTLKG
ncbi:MAG: c-type cytochrome [Anaerolineaceae bacterium]|nr:c-type cytochrome [Anaerolineaceae bacterium]